MEIVEFTGEYIAEAAILAKACYEEERLRVPALPPVEILPELTGFAENGYGVAAIEDGRLIGFLCFYPPRENAFTTYARGTFSPIHAHGTILKGRENIYKRMYQAAAAKLAKAGISSHAVGLYAHDDEAISAFFTYGFGLRCMDAIRPMSALETDDQCEYTIRCLKPGEAPIVRDLRLMLSEHMSYSPCFMYSTEEETQEWLKSVESRESMLFAAFDKDKAIAFMEVTDEGENFATEIPGMRNICGAFCLPEYRGKGLFTKLLNYAVSVLREEGYTRLGVDFESINPTAYGFWLKYFSAYTKSVVRRIDEKVLQAEAKL